MVFENDFEEIEGLAVVDILRRAKLNLTMIGLTDKTVESAQKVKVGMDTTVDEADLDKFDMLIMPGGAGTENYFKVEKLKKAIASFIEEEKWVCAICAAPSILGRWGVLKGKTVTGYPTIDIPNANIKRERIVIDGKLITSMGPGTATEFALEIVAQICGKETADSLKKQMLL
ncbi:hypothetical protein AN396_06225 [Candidatus Epulonipiscium fishelsonii]|uniref:Uncharacterized protein n=1 Tax=Candidatus Epulonipiscium fishelsonii TaxID=77094 RepID=A0ACC8XCW7_9FIRM|nr:hypothetical protein AN396_06225 [Epulopiscium sp. SCG-B11WGA-EpuloA1]